MNQRVASLIAVISLSGSLIGMDIVRLRDGGSLQGKAKAVQLGKQTIYVVDLGEGMKVSVSKGDVARVETESDKIAAYRDQLSKTPDEAAAQWELARWCKANTLLPQYDRHVRHVIRLDPDHPTARASLGYVEHEGQWVLNDELQRSRGLVHHLGKWKVPADVRMSEAMGEREIDQKQWRRKILRLRATARKNGKAAGEALAELQEIKDPLAAAAIGAILREQKDVGPIRMLWVKLLSQWETADAVDALILASLFDPEAAIREACIDRLEQFGKQRAVNTYISLLRSDNNQKVRIAADALRAMKDPRSILPLTDALVTQHKRKVGGGPGMQSTFDKSGNGGGGFTFGGGKEEIVEDDVPNPPVLSALMTMAPDADFQYDEARWRQYFSQRLAEFPYDLRRDP